MKLALQLIPYFSSKDFPQLFASLRAQTFQDWELFVHENSENLEEQERVRVLLEQSGLHYHYVVSTNIGFAKAHNAMFAMHNAAYVMLVNADAFLDPLYLESCVTYLDQHPTCAAVTGVVFRWVGETVPQRDDTTLTIDTAGLDYRALGEVRDLYAGMRRDALHASALQIGNVFGVSGSLPVYRRSAVLDVSPDGLLLDNAFFMYKEDVDLAIRLRRKGYTAARVGEALAFHRRGLKDDVWKSWRDRVRAEKKRPLRLRAASYQNQWFIYGYHWSFALGTHDLWRTFTLETKRGIALFVLGSPKMFFQSWWRILSSLPYILRKRRKLVKMGMKHIKLI